MVNDDLLLGHVCPRQCITIRSGTWLYANIIYKATQKKKYHLHSHQIHMTHSIQPQLTRELEKEKKYSKKKKKMSQIKEIANSIYK